MKLIDREPTEEMIEAMRHECMYATIDDLIIREFQAAYDAAPEIQHGPIAHVYRNEYGTIRIDQQYLPSEGSFPVYAIPPDAQAEIAKRDERIAEIESRLNEVALDWQMLAAQNQQIREQFQMILDADYRKWEDLASPDEFVRWSKSRANHMLQLPDLASPVLNRVKADVLRSAADELGGVWAIGPCDPRVIIRNMADAIEKGEV